MYQSTPRCPFHTVRYTNIQGVISGEVAPMIPGRRGHQEGKEGLSDKACGALQTESTTGY